MFICIHQIWWIVRFFSSCNSFFLSFKFKCVSLSVLGTHFIKSATQNSTRSTKLWENKQRFSFELSKSKLNNDNTSEKLLAASRIPPITTFKSYRNSQNVKNKMKHLFFRCSSLYKKKNWINLKLLRSMCLFAKKKMFLFTFFVSFNFSIHKKTCKLKCQIYIFIKSFL